MAHPKLVVLRGPSGSGKTTIARELFAAAPRDTVLVEQDSFRFMFKPPGGRPESKTLHAMLQHSVALALRDGYHVILEGILRFRRYREVFEALRGEPAQHHFAYFDISFEESLRRHATRPPRGSFTVDDMKEWYRPHDFTGYPGELIIDQASSPAETLARLRTATGL